MWHLSIEGREVVTDMWANYSKIVSLFTHKFKGTVSSKFANTSTAYNAFSWNLTFQGRFNSVLVAIGNCSAVFWSMNNDYLKKHFFNCCNNCITKLCALIDFQWHLDYEISDELIIRFPRVNFLSKTIYPISPEVFNSQIHFVLETVAACILKCEQWLA